MQSIETKVHNRAVALGYALGHQHVGGGRTLRTVIDPETGTVFAEGKDCWALLPVLWSIPAIAGRRPRPSVEDLAREAAEAKGYDVVARPNGGIAIIDPSAPTRAVAVHPFWLGALRSVLELPSIARPKLAPRSIVKRTVAPARPIARRTGRAVQEEEQLELEGLTEEQRGELEAERETECAACGGRVPGGCPECAPPGTFDDNNPPPRVA